MAQSNPKPTSHADRAAVTSDRVTRAAKRASSVPTADPPTPAVAAPAESATAAPLAVVPELPPVADAPTTEAPASVAITSPSVPAVPVSTAVAAPSPVPTLVPVSAAVVAALTHISTATPTAPAKPPRIAKPAAPASKATTSSAAKANAVTAAWPAATALPATKTTATAAAPATASAPQPATTSPPASAAAQNAAQPSAALVPTTPSNDVIAPTASSTPRGRVHSPGPDFPPVSASRDESPKLHAQKRKENKAKGKAKAPCPPAPTQSWISPTPSPTHSDDEGFLDEGCTSYDLDADLNRALKMSVGEPTDMDTGASSSRRAATCATVNSPPMSPKRPRTDSGARGSPASPPKRQRANEEGQPPSTHIRHSGWEPPRGFVPFHEHLTRVIYGLSTRTLYRNHPARQLSQWNEVPQPKVAATISGGNGDRIQTAELVRTSIADRFNAPRASLLIGTPGLAENNGPDPIAWLIAGISADQAQTLIDMGCLCSDTITIFFHEYHPPISGFMGTWQGFTMAESDAELAHRIIIDAVLTDPAITRFVRAHRDSFPADMIADECLELFGNHIITLPINLLSPRGPFVAWNVYIKSPTNDEEAFNTLHGLFQRLIIDTPFHGQGRIYTRPLHCNICLSIDHPTNLCLLPSIPGWLGPTPKTIGALLDATREVLNPRAKKSGGRPRDDKNKGKGKGKDRDDRKGDRKGGDRRCGN
ncbi:hypothetical protein DFH08DRAFT_817440 [Mycena albidolilacea]|uniref:Uncharacterized protein n=1 Tax=Mycena albidolilacea TaxID=1033008 RepID=A0AAD7EIF5_9AGAR|nr:hypothetical protein DFH08DRAFT_817440 [Mycena albidolilacea]